jgi:hypothetical protein
VSYGNAKVDALLDGHISIADRHVHHRRLRRALSRRR